MESAGKAVTGRMRVTAVSFAVVRGRSTLLQAVHGPGPRTAVNQDEQIHAELESVLGVPKYDPIHLTWLNRRAVIHPR